MKERWRAKAEPATQQSKMKPCNVNAKDKKGDGRKAFMNQCLRKKPVGFASSEMYPQMSDPA